MKADRKRLKAEKTDLVSQMQQLYATLESREEQLRDFIRNYEQHRKVRLGAGVRPLGFLLLHRGKKAAKWGLTPCKRRATPLLGFRPCSRGMVKKGRRIYHLVMINESGQRL